MKVLLTSGTGYIGESLAQALLRAGHEVTALARSSASADKLEAAGVTAVDGNIGKPGAVAQEAVKHDAVIHTAFTYEKDCQAVEDALARALVGKLHETQKHLVYTSGVWVYGHVTGSQAITEDAALVPAPIVAWRPAVEQIYLDAASAGITSCVIRPAMVYGGTRGIIGDMFKYARKHGVVRYVGTGTNKWSLIHVEDLANLYVRALTLAAPGTIFNGSAGEAMSVHDVALVVAERAGIASKVQSWPLEEAQKQLGLFAEALTRSVVVSSSKAQRELAWMPTAPALADAYPQEATPVAAH
jgi:nucleoside-diphosphate-sugar epimerase